MNDREEERSFLDDLNHDVVVVVVVVREKGNGNENGLQAKRWSIETKADSIGISSFPRERGCPREYSSQSTIILPRTYDYSLILIDDFQHIKDANWNRRANQRNLEIGLSVIRKEERKKKRWLMSVDMK
jgi:hypothetical protein